VKGVRGELVLALAPLPVPGVARVVPAAVSVPRVFGLELGGAEWAAVCAFSSPPSEFAGGGYVGGDERTCVIIAISAYFTARSNNI
jgi:hypothetical protein